MFNATVLPCPVGAQLLQLPGKAQGEGKALLHLMVFLFG
jgi:hypothetical protein